MQINLIGVTMSKIGIYILGLLLLSSFVSATFSATMMANDSHSDEIYKDEIAEYLLTITNNGPVVDRYQIYSIDPNWEIYAVDNLIEVPSGETMSFVIRVSPKVAIQNSGNYKINFNIKSVKFGGVKEIEKDLLIKSESHRNFVPAVYLTAKVNDGKEIDPRDPLDLKILLSNKNGLSLPDLDVSVESPLFEGEYKTSLGPNEESIKILSYDIDPFTLPSTYDVIVTLRKNSTILYQKNINFTVQKNNLFFVSEKQEEASVSSLLRERDNVIYTNLGNVAKVQTITYKINYFQNLFTETEPESRFVNGNLEFELELNPNESKVIIIDTDYRATFWTLLTLIILIIVITALYFLFRSPVVLSKEAIVIKNDEGTGNSDIKILINIKNRTGKVLEDMKIVDRIPGITEIEKEFTLGTLKPQKIIRHPKKGTLIRWEFPSMDAYEERIITYRIHSKLGILGNLSLPSTIIKFTSPSGVKRTYKSNLLKQGEI